MSRDPSPSRAENDVHQMMSEEIHLIVSDAMDAVSISTRNEQTVENQPEQPLVEESLRDTSAEDVIDREGDQPEHELVEEPIYASSTEDVTITEGKQSEHPLVEEHFHDNISTEQVIITEVEQPENQLVDEPIHGSATEEVTITEVEHTDSEAATLTQPTNIVEFATTEAILTESDILPEKSTEVSIEENIPHDYQISFEAPHRWYENLKTYFTTTSVAETTTIACNTQYFAYLDTQGSGSSIAVLPYSSMGKNHIPVNSPAYQQPIIRAHSQLVSDFAFNPFHSNVLYSCSADRLLKTWKLPESGLTVDMSVASSSLSTKSKCALRSLTASSLVDSLLAVRGSREISLFDMTANKEIFTTTETNPFFQGDILSMAWSYHNDYLLTTSKDRFIRVFDPRINPKQFSLVQDWIGHTGFRYCSVIPREDQVTLFSFGHNAKTQEREICLWDLRNVQTSKEPIFRQVIDKKDGALYPIYDEDHRLLYVTGKGETHLHLYRMSSDATSIEEIFNEQILTDSFNGRDVVKGMVLLPKTSQLLQSNREIGRILKLSDGLVQPLVITSSTPSIPDEGMITRSGAPPALTVSQWTAGETRPPRTVIVVPASPDQRQEESGATASGEKSPGPSNRDSMNVSNSDTTGKRASALRVSQATMKYRHLYGKEPKKELTYYNLQPDLTALDSPIIAGNENYWAIPYRGGGGPVYISKHSNYGKVLPECLTLNGHKSTVQEIAFSPFHEDLMITGSFDCTLKLWNVQTALEAYEQQLAEAQRQQSYPKITSINMTYTETLASFTQHTNSIRTVNFHPTVPNLFCSTSQDMTLRFFDVNTVEEISCLKVVGSYTGAAEIANAMITNVSFNYDGTQLIMASKDRQLRLVDPRRNTIVQTVQHEKYLGRNLRVAWCGRSLAEDPVVTVSAGTGGLRQIALWDPRRWEEPVAVRMIDNASGQLFPMYDEGLNVVYVAGKGDTIIRGFEISSLPVSSEETEAGTENSTSSSSSFNYLMEKCCDYQTMGRESIAGVCMLPKRVVDYRNVEVNRLLKLSNDSVIPIHFHVPRADYLKDYFHDDIFLPIRSNSESRATISDWKNLEEGSDSSIFSPILESLKPVDMMNVSEKPETPVPSQTNSKIHSYRENIAKKEEETKQNEEKFNRLQQLAFQNAQYHQNNSGPMKIGSVVVSNPQLQKASGGGGDDDSDSDVDWS